MNEITKRFEIIRLAIQLGDFETILVQCEKLPEISADEHLNDIIELLKSRSYRQALYEMRYYAQSLLEESSGDCHKETDIAPPSGKVNKEPQPKPRSETQPAQSNVQEIGLNEMMKMADNTKERVKEYVSIPEFPAEDILKEFKKNMDSNREKRIVSNMEKEKINNLNNSLNDFGRNVNQLNQKPMKIEVEEESININFPENTNLKKVEEERVDSRNIENSNLNINSNNEINLNSINSVSDMNNFNNFGSLKVETEDRKQEENIKIKTPLDNTVGIKEDDKKDLKDAVKKSKDKDKYDETFAPISYIEQKYKNMISLFPPVENSKKFPEVVVKMKEKLSREEYGERDIEEFLDFYFKYKESGKKDFAAKVLLLGASTESKFAKLLLGRELYKGEILKKNNSESFNLINSLADQNYPEAICDLGQFYEYGIGVSKDKQMAKLLYQEAADLGVERAKKHYEKINREKGVMGILKKLSLAKKTIKRD